MLYCMRNFRPITLCTIQAICNDGHTCLGNSFKRYSSSKNPKDENEITVGGLAKALGKFRDLEKTDMKEIKPFEQKSFLHMLRHSEFVQMGDPVGKIVIGKIFQVVNTDLYIDFGGKFFCVCRKPKKNSEMYVRNARVKLRINELELCAKFLGAVEDLTLTEASGSLLGLIWTPLNSKKEITQEAKS